MGLVEGIDVSKWQGTIDWSAVAGSKFRFALLKATESTSYIDPSFARNSAAVTVPWGAYHYGRPSKDPRVCAAHHFAVVEGAGRPTDFPLILDIEEHDGLSAAGLTAWVLSWSEKAEDLSGRPPIIYANPNYVNNRMTYDVRLERFPLWLAHWVNEPQSNIVSAPGVWDRWLIWQTSAGRVPDNPGKGAAYPEVPGIRGDVDRNLMYAEDLAALTGKATVEPETTAPPVTVNSPDVGNTGDLVEYIELLQDDNEKHRTELRRRAQRLRTLKATLET